MPQRAEFSLSLFETLSCAKVESVQSPRETICDWPECLDVHGTIRPLAEHHPQLSPDWEPENLSHEWEQVETISNWEDSIPSLEELLKNSQSVPHRKTPTENLQVDVYGFLIDDSNTNWEQEAKPSKMISAEKWNQIISQWSSYSEERKRKIKQKIRKGVPNDLRGELWKLLANISDIHADSLAVYPKLLREESVHESQINIDLSRTLPKNVYFAESGGAGQRALFNALKAYSNYNSSLGYCQGMGFICAVILLYMSEQEAFSMMRRIIIDYQLEGFFQIGFPTLYRCFFIHENLMSSWLPRIGSHFKKLEIKASMYSFGWYTTLFVNSLAFPYIVRIFDLFFAEGMKVLFRIAMAILKLMQKQLLASNFEEAVMMLKNLGKSFHASPQELLATAMEFTLSNKRMEKLGHIYDKQQAE